MIAVTNPKKEQKNKKSSTPNKNEPKDEDKAEDIKVSNEETMTIEENRILPYHTNKTVEFGDLVLIYEGRDSFKFFYLESGKIFQNGYGAFKHNDIEKKTYGTKIYSSSNKKGEIGHITILYFITNIWDKCLKRMTQILFNNDINLILTMLNISSRSVIYESGTGSGCLSVNMAQCLGERGHLYTFEFNMERANSLKETFKSLGFGKKITVTHRDVIENGFDVAPEDLVIPEHDKADAIFIDLPSPWRIIDKAKKHLKSGGYFVSFSPCIEQVSMTYKAFKENEFINIRMFESQYRIFNYNKTVQIEVPDARSLKRKAGEEFNSIKQEILTFGSRNDMRGHTGFLMVAINL